VETSEEGVMVRFLAHRISKVDGCAGALGWRLKWVTNRLIIHMNLHKLNNKLVSAWLEHFWCTDKSRAYTNSQDLARLRLGGSHHLPLYSILSTWPQGLHSNVILSWDNKIETLATLESHNFLCRPLIEVRFEAKF